ncbi:MAG: glycerophosphodiester phosphodiesterase family protein [Runella sp.]
MKSLLLGLFFLLNMLKIMAQTPSFDWQGHRGCRGLMPENTIPAFKKALDLGMTTLELDVVVSKDLQVVVSHEPYFNPDFSIAPDGTPVAKNQKINLYQLPYEQIKRYDVGRNGNPNFPEQQKISTYKPLLREVIEEVETYRKQKNLPSFNYNIEIKSEPKEYDIFQPQPAVFSDLVKNIIVELLPAERVTLQSFDFNVLKYWHHQIQAGRYPKVALAALVGNLRGIEKNLEELGFVPQIYSPYYKLIDAKKVAQLHALGMRVIPWTINTTQEMQQVKAYGVDGIITDYPDRIPR